MRASPTDILAKKIARVGQVGGQVGEDPRACPSVRLVEKETTNGQTGSTEHTPGRLWEAEQRSRRHLRDNPRAEVGEEVRVGVRVGAVECQLYLADLCNSRSRRETKNSAMGLSCGVICVILRLAVLIQYRSVTDTHTHRQTDTRRRHIYRA